MIWFFGSHQGWEAKEGEEGAAEAAFGSVLLSSVDLSRERSSLSGPLESELALWKSLKLGS